MDLLEIFKDAPFLCDKKVIDKKDFIIEIEGLTIEDLPFLISIYNDITKKDKGFSLKNINVVFVIQNIAKFLPFLETKIKIKSKETNKRINLKDVNVVEMFMLLSEFQNLILGRKVGEEVLEKEIKEQS